MSLTTDPNDPRLKEGQKNETGQHEIYLVLSEEERSKGFVRPVRSSYVHIGKDIKSHWKEIHKILTEEERKEYNGKYVAIMTILTKEDGSFMGGPLITQEELDAWKAGERIGGCGEVTSMGNALSETYARDPKFYGATYCTGCGKHLPVGEFVWYGTNEKVGS